MRLFCGLPPTTARPMDLQVFATLDSGVRTEEEGVGRWGRGAAPRLGGILERR